MTHFEFGDIVKYKDEFSGHWYYRNARHAVFLRYTMNFNEAYVRFRNETVDACVNAAYLTLVLKHKKET